MVPLDRFMALRDGASVPETEEEVFELARFEFRCGSAEIEQALAQHKPASPIEIREMEKKAVKKIIKIYKDYIVKMNEE